MDFNQLTLKTQDAIENAGSLAQQNDHCEIGLEHILLSLLNQKDGMIKPVLERIGVNVSS